MSSLEPAVLYRDDWFLVLDKPSGLPTTGPGRDRTLVDCAHALDPNAPRLHPSSRLDAEVSGACVFARTTEAIAHLLAARRAHAYARGYLALAARAPEPRAGSWRASIAIDPRDPRKRTAGAASTKGAREAETRYRCLRVFPAFTVLWLEPLTGRTHQLRVHASHAGVPLLGDRHYGGASRIVLAEGQVIAARRTMLHCARVSVPNPSGAGTLSFEAPLPSDLTSLCLSLGGEVPALPT